MQAWIGRRLIAFGQLLIGWGADVVEIGGKLIRKREKAPEGAEDGPNE